MKILVAALAAVLALGPGLSEARSKKHPHSHPPTSVSGKFDYYVLSLSWSPAYCETHPQDTQQCVEQHFGFVLHGLWPQYKSGGYPQNCATPNQLDESARSFGKTVFPSEKLVSHEWERHGTCSGLPAQDYFKTADTAHQSIHIPPQLEPGTHTVKMTASAISKALRDANPALTNSAVAVVCAGPELQEVRVCMTRDLKPMPCGTGVKTSCSRTTVKVPGAH